MLLKTLGTSPSSLPTPAKRQRQDIKHHEGKGAQAPTVPENNRRGNNEREQGETSVNGQHEMVRLMLIRNGDRKKWLLEMGNKTVRLLKGRERAFSY